MNIRSFIPAALILASLPLAGCSGDDDDSGTTTATMSKWAGHTYALTTTARDWAEPKGLGKDIENVMPVFMFQVSQSGSAVTARMGIAPKKLDSAGVATSEVVQDLCSPTYELPVSGAAPKSQMGPNDVQLHLVNPGDLPDTSDDVQVTAKVTGLGFTDIFPPNGSTWDDPDDKPGELRATMDFRELAPLFTLLYENNMPPTAQKICDQLGTDNACVACADGVATCVSARAVFIGAENRADLSVKAVDINSRPATCGN